MCRDLDGIWDGIAADDILAADRSLFGMATRLSRIRRFPLGESNNGTGSRGSMGILRIGRNEQACVQERERVMGGIVERNLVTARQLQRLAEQGL